jgi:hypothetical protein
MAAIQNFKNFLRHGKQARQNAEPTTNVSNVHAQSQQQRQHAPDPVHHGISEPIMAQKQQHHGNVPHGDFSVAGGGDNRNVAAQAGAAAERAAADKQKMQAAAQGKGVDPSVLERIVAEEREAKGKMPRYPGLERWTLLEKMGDGAFSNVYRARDTTGQWGEVAIKVVRKFEMNSQQVSIALLLALTCPFFMSSFHSYRIIFNSYGVFERYQHEARCRISMCIRTSKRQKQPRCALPNLTAQPQQYQPYPYYVYRASTDVMPNRERISSRKYRLCANWIIPTLSSSSTFPRPSSTTTSSWSFAQVANCSIRSSA